MAELNVPEDPVVVLKNLLLESRTEEALLQLKTHDALITEKILDVIPQVCEVLRKEEGHSEVGQCCEQILVTFAETGNPKEVLMGLLEQVNCIVNDRFFSICLKPIQKVLLRLPSKRGQSMIWVFNILHQYVKSLALPRDYKLEGEEKLLLDLDEDVQRIQNVLAELIWFYAPFVQEVSWRSCKDVQYKDRICYQRFILLSFLMQLLDCPLFFLDLTHTSGKPKSGIRDCSEKLIDYIKDLECNVFKFFEKHDGYTAIASNKVEKEETSNEEIAKISRMSLATFYYLIFSEGLALDHVPCIYSQIYLFESCLPYIILFLKREETCVIEKGLRLTTALLNCVKEMAFTIDSLDFGCHFELANSLIKVMLFCDAQSLRQVSVKIFRNVIEKFEFPARFQLLKNVLSSVKHAGVQGLLIQLYKDNLNCTLSMQPVPPWFINKNLSEILQLIVPLPEGVSTDILEKSDCIMAVLNLIRYIAIRDDPLANVTGLWNSANISFIEESLLTPLQTSLNLSRSHYKLEFKHQQENKNTGSSPVALSVNGCPLPSMPKEQKLQVLKLALNTFDMMESILARVSELLSGGKKKIVN